MATPPPSGETRYYKKTDWTQSFYYFTFFIWLLNVLSWILEVLIVLLFFFPKVINNVWDFFPFLSFSPWSSPCVSSGESSRTAPRLNFFSFF